MATSQPTRRTALANLAAASVAFSQPPRARKPNFLFILADDHAGYVAGVDGNRQASTPNIDRLAGEGTPRFDHAYCQAPVCVPARESILTGLYPHQHGARIPDDPLPDHIPTVAEFFKNGAMPGARSGKCISWMRAHSLTRWAQLRAQSQKTRPSHF